MYSKKYCLIKIEELGEHNPIYDDVEGRVCYLAYLNIGERGWFLWETDDWFNTTHRVHTSTINNVEYKDNWVFVETNNTKFTFALINTD